MRLPCIKHWLLLGSGSIFLRGSAARPADETDAARPQAADGIAKIVNPETFLGACPEYEQYASHKQ